MCIYCILHKKAKVTPGIDWNCERTPSRKGSLQTASRQGASWKTVFMETIPNGAQWTALYLYREQSSVWRLSNYWPPTPSSPSECILPSHQRRGYTLAGRWGGGGSIFRKTPDIGLASYSIIPLRHQGISKRKHLYYWNEFLRKV